MLYLAYIIPMSRGDFASADGGLHLLPLLGIERDCLSIMSNLTLAHLYSSIRLVIGSERTLFPYSPILMTYLGNPSHFSYVS